MIADVPTPSLRLIAVTSKRQIGRRRPVLHTVPKTRHRAPDARKTPNRLAVEPRSEISVELVGFPTARDRTST